MMLTFVINFQRLAKDGEILSDSESEGEEGEGPKKKKRKQYDEEGGKKSRKR